MCGPGGGKAGTLLGQTWQRVEAGRGATITAVPSLHVSDLGTVAPAQMAPKYPPPVRES